MQARLLMNGFSQSKLRSPCEASATFWMSCSLIEAQRVEGQEDRVEPQHWIDWRKGPITDEGEIGGNAGYAKRDHLGHGKCGERQEGSRIAAGLDPVHAHSHYLLSPPPSNASALTSQRPRKPVRRPPINRIATKSRS